MKTSMRSDSVCSVKHNRTVNGNRELTSRELVHPERTKDNINIIDIDPIKAYKTIFDPVIEDYNNRQKRKDRKIQYDAEGYYNKLLNGTFNHATKQGNKQGKQHPYYEIIAQIGNADEQPPEDVAVAIMTEYVHDLQERTKGHLVIIGAYIHLDETTPHLHLDYIPVARMKKGMSLQVGLNKAFEQLMGYESKNWHDTAQQQFQAQERENFRNLCIKHNLNIDPIEHNAAKHQKLEEYIQNQKLKDIEIIEAIDKTEISDTARQTILQKLTKSDMVTISQKDYNDLKAQAGQAKGLMGVLKQKDETIRQQAGRLEKFSQGIADEQQQLRNERQELTAKEEKITRMENNFQKAINGEMGKKLTDEIAKLKRERNSLRDEVGVLEERLGSLKTVYNRLKTDVEELKEWLDENIVTKLEKKFCRQNQEEFDKFAEREKARNRGLGR